MGGQKWDLASKIFAAPMLLFPGGTLLEGDLLEYLDRLGYLKTEEFPPRTGEWTKKRGQFVLGVRSFRVASNEHVEKTLVLGLEEASITSLGIWNPETQKVEEAYTATLEPERIGDISSSQKEDRSLIRLEEVPSGLVNGILVMEDRAFYDHHGISFRGIARAFFSNLTPGGAKQGGSTLTQQLMKNFFLTPERTLRRKFKEAIMTVIAEALYSKDEILEAYLNEIYLGQRGSFSIHGFGEASRFYFSKRIQYLTLAEQALLAGLIQSPGRYSPYRSPENAEKRKRLVLAKLLEFQKISEEEYQRALAETLKPRGRRTDRRQAPYFLDYVRRDLAKRFSSVSLEKEGYEIHTTLDPIAQKYAEQASKEGLRELQMKSQLGEEFPLQVAMVSVHPRTGNVKALIGGRSYEESQFNRAIQARRQVGSLMKPFVAAIALRPPEKGRWPVATPSTLLHDEPTTFMFSGKEWAPSNYDDVYGGKVTVRRAIERSLNVAVVNLLTKVGMHPMLNGLKDFGINLGDQQPSLALGAIEMSPLEVLRAYTAFVNQGLWTEPLAITAVIDQNGRPIEQKALEVTRALTPQTAYQVLSILEGVVSRGTARSIGWHGLKGSGIAGKTGTTDDYRDSWFVGLTPENVTTVWVGLDENQETGLTGASGALQIWIRFEKEMKKRSRRLSFETPSGLSFRWANWEKGCLERGEKSLREAYLPGTEPKACR